MSVAKTGSEPGLASCGGRIERERQDTQSSSVIVLTQHIPLGRLLESRGSTPAGETCPTCREVQ